MKEMIMYFLDSSKKIVRFDIMKQGPLGTFSTGNKDFKDLNMWQWQEDLRY